ncbi:MAG: TraR/DksA family transcriptional regulator [Jatrophihabitantaceae bacterium]
MNATPVRAVHETAVPPRQLASFHEQLAQQRQFRLEQLEELRAIDPDDRSEVTAVLAAGARSSLGDVLAALDRLADGTYGVCVDCGTRLPLNRLEVLPQVAHCLRCSQHAAARAGR